MATIKFYPYLEKGKSKVYVRVTIKRGQDFRLSTTLTINDATKWNTKSGYPRKNDASNKKLFNSLMKLEKRIDDDISDIEKSQKQSTQDISSQWLKQVILDQLNETKSTDKDLLIPYAKSFVKSLPQRTYQRNGKLCKYKKITIGKYENFVKRLENYEEYLKTTIKIKHVDDVFANKFLSYLKDKKGMSINTLGRYVKRLKTIIKDAELNGSSINPKYRSIKGFEDETVVTFLTFNEIEKIIETKMPNKRLEIVKDWLIIGAFSAQRISDMFRMNKTMLITERGINYIALKQFKTGKNVRIPIHYHIEPILEKYDNGFPPNLSNNEQSNRSMLSTLMKKVCELSGIKEKVRGRFNGKIGIYPKYKLIQNHSLRRSFASNFYGMEGWTTPMIMDITGHITEKNFLKYIDKDDFYLSEKAAENFARMKEEALNKKDVTLKKA